MVNLPSEYYDKSVTPVGGMTVIMRFLECAVVQLSLTKHARLTKGERLKFTGCFIV